MATRYAFTNRELAVFPYDSVRYHAILFDVKVVQDAVVFLTSYFSFQKYSRKFNFYKTLPQRFKPNKSLNITFKVDHLTPIVIYPVERFTRYKFFPLVVVLTLR